MTVNIDELRGKIAEKNLVLNSLRPDQGTNKEKISGLKVELDKLLYLYLKSLKCECSDVLIC